MNNITFANVATLVIYFLTILFVGFLAYRKTSSHSDYVLGGRSLGSIVTALGVGASDMSGWLMLGLPGAAYATGLSAIWLPLGLSVGAFLNWTFVAKKLRSQSEKAGDALTIPAYIAAAFPGKERSLRLLTAVVILFFFVFYSASGFVAGATLFTELFGIPYGTALLISAPILIVYTAVGGFLAVNWVDVMQGFLMLFALLVIPMIAIMHVGGLQLAWQGLQNIPTHLTLLDEASFGWLAAISFMAWGLGYFGQPHILVRFMASASEQSIGTAKKICMTWMITALLAAIAVGFTGVLVEPNLARPETIFLHLSQTLFNPWVAGILFAAVLSSIMSTVAAQLLLCATSLVEDGYHCLFNPHAGERRLVWMERAVVVLTATCAVLIATNPASSILMLVSHAWAGLGASFGPVILARLYWKKLTYLGTLLGIVFGAVGVIFWLLARYFDDSSIFIIYEIIPGFFLSVVGIILGSKLTATQAPDH